MPLILKHLCRTYNKTVWSTVSKATLISIIPNIMIFLSIAQSAPFTILSKQSHSYEIVYKQFDELV